MTAPDRPPPAAQRELADWFREAVAAHRAGRLDEAEAIYGRILERAPDQPDALNMLGVAAGQRGRPDRAVGYFERALARDRRNPVALHNLGLARQACGDLDGAIEAFRKALEIKPDDIAAMKSLGGAYLAAGRFDEAERACRAVVQRTPTDPRAHHNLASVLITRGDMVAAERSVREALRLAPNLAAAHSNHGVVLLAREAFAEAAEALTRALALEPRYAEAHNNLGLAYLGLGRTREALASFREAIAINPGYMEAHCNLGRAGRELGEPDQAAAAFRAALERQPGHLQALLGLGNAHLDAGRLDEALECFEQVLAADPASSSALASKAALFEIKGEHDTAFGLLAPRIEAGERDPAMVSVFGRIAARKGRGEEALALVEEALARDGLEGRQRRSLHFTAAGLYDAAGDTARAFAHYQAANALKATDYEPARMTALVDRLCAHYDAERFAASPRARNRSQLPVFIVGMPRSGTTLTEQILASHHAVHGAGELNDLQRLVRRLIERGGGQPDAYPAVVAELAAGDLDAIAEEHLERLRGLGGEALRVTDKMPYNFLHLGLIAQLFPAARVIHCVRDPLDTCLSCFFQDFRRGNEATYDLRHVGLYWRDYHRLMRHWRETLPLPILDVPYEALVADLEGWARRVVDFAGLEWDPACLRFHESGRVVDTASYNQVREPIYTRSVGRWRAYADHLGPLREALGDLV